MNLRRRLRDISIVEGICFLLLDEQGYQNVFVALNICVDERVRLSFPIMTLLS